MGLQKDEQGGMRNSEIRRVRRRPRKWIRCRRLVAVEDSRILRIPGERAAEVTSEEKTDVDKMKLYSQDKTLYYVYI